ncbi:Cytosolic Fe-S cluster assembly factor nar1 [Extremus antarcticus]|uniref:Nuclear architecture-related protein 1 n=1 Tax=Extremus antarcticus TaxID=702011 RepID=A0AAJ0DAP0_9PEZI|nr:Cytosolic Fe-S cluster assembly factor nar1 [Extremus antarcticus]
MSAILSADDLNDFINPGVACIKPVETLPKQQPTDNPYEVTTEDKVAAANPPPAQISLTDCLACSGCVTSAEAVLVSLQSHSEVLSTLDGHKELRLPWEQHGHANGEINGVNGHSSEGKIFVASVSPQTRASLAATYNVSEREAGNMIAQLLSGPYGLRSGGANGSGFTWIIDTNVMREACLVAAADEVQQALTTPTEGQKKPILTSACPGWICYAEKTHPHILPHLSKLKSPQALTGTLVKSILAKRQGISPENVWHMAVMPCFDKKLEASRSELTSHSWHAQDQSTDPVRDVDCVITARELLMLAESRHISFPCLPRTQLPKHLRPSFPDPTINSFLFGRRNPKHTPKSPSADLSLTVGTSGGYLTHVLQTHLAAHPSSTLSIQRGRNADVAEYTILSATGTPIFRAARYYGFRNIQNLVRRLKPAKASRMPGAVRKLARKPGAGGGGPGEGEYSYVEVMACPGGCTNGGGQIKVGDVATLRQIGGTGVENGSAEQIVLPAQREWLGVVDEAYWSADDASTSSSADDDDEMDVDGDGDTEMNDHHNGINGLNGDHTASGDNDIVNGISRSHITHILHHWAKITDVELEKLIYTTYRAVESDVGKENGGGATEMERVSALAVAQGGGW